MPTTLQPTNLELDDDGRLLIDWSDGTRRRYRAFELRDRCPCATCREKRRAPAPSPLELNVLSPAEARPVAIQGMQPVGRYAYAIHFSDGHDTGIYTFESLREMGEAI
ncbi:MAG: DUF971 domain-containing protein [Planctomycetales bacterium]|nr:DUF971 domain-containing protein [Planctomycetales bacterium]